MELSRLKRKRNVIVKAIRKPATLMVILMLVVTGLVFAHEEPQGAKDESPTSGRRN